MIFIGKILCLNQLKSEIALRRTGGWRTVFTNGCFDLLHPGHVRLLQAARKLGDALVVAVNDDCSVQHLKGKLRPLIPAPYRAEMLAALECVDYVVIFGELTPEKIIAEIRPEIYVKAGYRREELPEIALVESYGGRIVLFPLLTGYSTTGIIALILIRYFHLCSPVSFPVSNR
ncbi:MAG: adenylyltransferase/cytidyltransferase family protein [Bacillota bacterium]